MLGEHKRVACHTLGCKTNQYETDAIRMQFVQAGYSWVPFSDEADVYLVNTCSVTAEADRKTRQFIRRAKKKNPDALVVAIGCQVTLQEAEETADLAISNQDKSRVRQLVEEKLAQGTFQPQVDRAAQRHGRWTYDELGPVTEQSETRALVKIEDGCNQFCSYCTIPLARGRVRSRSRTDVLREVEGLARQGCQEIVLTGIHICSYGSDLGLPPDALAQLALDLSHVPGLVRIRLGSLEPGFLSPSFVALAEKNSKLCPHFHLSLQSGSDRILKAMNRPYRTAGFREAVGLLRDAFGDPALTTDVIVGFPGETEDDFEQTLAFCQEMAFSKTHVFRYSERKNTKAAGLPGHVPRSVRARRSERLIQLAEQLTASYQERQLGRQLDVIVENQKGGHYEGYSANYQPVCFESGQPLKQGDRSAVLILGRDATRLLGQQTGPVFRAMIEA